MISLNEPFLVGNEKKYLNEAVKSTWVSTNGHFLKKFCNKINSILKIKYSFPCSSGTSALHLALLSVGVKKNDEIIVPSLTFIAPINAVKYVGANPIFMDVQEDHNLNIKKTIEFLEKKTYYKKNKSWNKKTNKNISAIIIVHMWGHCSNIYKLIKFCKRRGIKVIEDASEALGSKYLINNKKKISLGCLGDVGCLSFNGNKVITTGSGGMVVSNNKSIIKKANYLGNQAKDDSLRYIHNNIGFNYKMNNLQAAMGCAQLENLSLFLKNKRKIHKYYLNKINKLGNFSVLEPSKKCWSNNWMNILQIKTDFALTPFDIHKFLKKNGVETRMIWFPNHLQSKFKKYQTYKINYAKKIFNNSLCLPSSSFLTNKHILFIVNLLTKLDKKYLK